MRPTYLIALALFSLVFFVNTVIADLDYWVAYPEPNITSGFGNLTEYGNTVTGGYLGLGILLSFWVILFLIFRSKAGDMEALMASSFISFIVSGILVAMHLISGMWVIIPMLVTAAGFFLAKRRTE